MKYEHKTIIDAATREGKIPSELAKELLGHDLLKAMVTAISKPAVAFSKMSEQQQEGVIEDLKKELLPAVSTAIGIIVSQNSHAIRVKLNKLTTGKSLQLTATLDKSQDHIHELMDLASDNSDVLVILHERDYVQGLDAVKGEKDQRSLPLDDSKPAKKPAAKKADAKPITLTEKQIEDGRQFILEVKKPTVAGMQAQLKFGHDKAIVALELYADEGLITRLGDDKYEMAKAAPDAHQGNPDLYGELTYSEVQQVIVLHAQTFELPWLVKRFGIDEDRANHLALALLDDGVIEAVIDLDDEDKRQYSVIAKLEDLVI